MQNTKLKKKAKGKNNDIIFPSTYLRNTGKVGKLKEEKEEGKKMEEKCWKFIERSRSQSNGKTQHKRSLSTTYKHNQQKNNNLQMKSQLQSAANIRTRKMSIEKRFKRGNSSMEISKIYYDHLQSKLSKECQLIMKQPHPKDTIKPYTLQQITNNLLFLKRKQVPKVAPEHSNTNTVIDSCKIILQSQISIGQQRSEQNKQQSKQLQKIEQSYVNISLSGQELQQSQKEIFSSGFKHRNSLQSDLLVNHPSQSLFKSQVKSSLLQTLKNIPIYFFSPKFSIKYTSYFKILSLNLFKNDQHYYQLQIYFQIYNQIIFKRVFFRNNQQRKTFDHRFRKGHLKKLQVARQKLKQKVISYFLRDYNEEIIIQFYQDLINFLEHFIILEKTYKGLVFVDNEQSSILELKNHEKIFELLKVNKSFHFILKLNFTFYLVKVIFSPQMEIKFTFIYDFTTHNAGDQLYYTFPAPEIIKPNKNQHKAILKVIENFVELISSEWKNQLTTNKEIEEKQSSAKIGQISPASIQKWNSAQILKMNNINKSYHLVGGLTNFFEYHDQFDYGFFLSPHHVLQNGQYSYSLDQINRYVPVYVYPHTFIYLQLSQIQKEMLLIPHVSQSMHQQHAKRSINSFFHRQLSKKYKKEHQYFTLFLNKQQIRMRQKQKQLQICIYSPKTLQCYKLIVPTQSFPSYNPQHQTLDMKLASSHIKQFMSSYKVEKGFLYSKLVNQQQKRLIVHYKGIEKLQGQFTFVSLYTLPHHQIMEFKIFMFKLGREFIIRFDSGEWLTQINLKELIANLLQLIKSIYFKKFIQEQARKSKKRRLDSLQNFLKKHSKSFVNNLRSKRKLDQHVKRRLMRLATLQQNKIGTIVYQNIITDYFKSSQDKQFLITIRYVPSQQFKEQSQWKNENIEICVHKEKYLHYFKYATSMRELVYSVSQGKMSIERIDFRQVYPFFKEVRNQIKQIVRSHSKNMSFIISRLKHFLIFNYQNIPVEISPYKYKLIQNILYQTKESVNSKDQVLSQISIELQMDKSIFNSNQSNLIFLPYLSTQQKQQQQFSTNFSFACKKPVNHPYRRYVDSNYIIEIINIFRKDNDYQQIKEYNFSNRQIWITDRSTGCRSVLKGWDTAFLGVIDFGQYNPGLFRRLLTTLKPAL